VKKQQGPGFKLLKECLRREAVCARLLRALTLVTNRAESVMDTLELYMRTICESTGWTVAHVRILARNDSSDEPLPRDVWQIVSGEHSEGLQDAIKSKRLSPAIDWHLRIVETARPVVLTEIAQEPAFGMCELAAEFGLKSAVGIPIVVPNQLRAVCEFFSPTSVYRGGLWDGVLANVSLVIANALERKWLKQSLSDMGSKLLNLQDDERRRLSRELHDITGQNLSMIIVDLDSIEGETEALPPVPRKILAECRELARKSLQEIRTLSYVLHPPLLDELGIVAAVRTFVEAFSERSGIHVDLDLPERPVPMPYDFQVTIFRVVQESLSNVLKHSRSSNAKVHLDFDQGRVAIQVQDEGRGLPGNNTGTSLLSLGVGIASMHERVKQCGGQLNIASRKKGTQVDVTMPLPQSALAVGV
jgi:signal transduction histidine kinase